MVASRLDGNTAGGAHARLAATTTLVVAPLVARQFLLLRACSGGGLFLVTSALRGSSWSRKRLVRVSR